MRPHKVIRALAVLMALLGLFLFVTEVGEAFEAWRHQPCDNDCIICHLPQQAVESAFSAQPTVIFERVGLLPLIPEPDFVPNSRELQLLTRAPPSL
jgi:hypothetical protein